LVPFYLFPTGHLYGWKIIPALALLVAISATAVLAWRKRPYLLVGWLWYLGMLVPMIGIMQVGSFAHADHFTYLPMIGLSVALTWATAEFAAKWQVSRIVLGALMAGVIAMLMVCAWKQTAYWKNSETLWRHTLVVTSNNIYALNNLGSTLAQKGQVDEAIIEYQQVLAINPNNVEAHNNLGNALTRKGQVDQAIIEYHAALAINPNFAEAYYNLGYALARKEQVDEAISEYQKALSINPDYAAAYYNLGLVFFQKGQVDEAITQFQQALAINPEYADACYNLGNALAQKGEVDEAISEYQKALAIDPNNAEACYNLGYTLAQQGRVDEAIIQFQQALAINPNLAEASFNLGDALYQKGRVDEAIIQFQKTLAIQPGFVAAQNNLTHIAWVMATSPNPSLRNGTKAVELAQQTDRLSGGGNPNMAATLAAADAEAGKFPEAIANAQRALQLASGQNNAAMIPSLEAQLKSYQAGFPFRDSGTSP
jgi:tetratricopeptide (TPR) repeat protein